jgi:hypothetical protein
MARYFSDDGIIDAPIEKVWKLIEAHNDPKNHIHAGIVSMKAHPQGDGSVLADVVTKGEKGNVDHKWKFTMKPPHAQIVEMIDGPMKGSWITTTYVPLGNKTRFVTVADWKIQGVTDEKMLLKLCNDFMEGGFEEDSRFLKTMH